MYPSFQLAVGTRTTLLIRSREEKKILELGWVAAMLTALQHVQ